MEKTEIEHEADRLSDVLQNPNYQATIGAWLEEIKQEALLAINRAEGAELLKAIGRKQAMEEVAERIEDTMDSADAQRILRLKESEHNE